MDFISNTKIGFGSYPGFSLLFDNPGRKSLSLRGKHFLKIDCQVPTDRNLKLYKGLWDSLSDLGLEELYATYQFFALPPSSYHVTVADGLNLGCLNNEKRPLTTDCEPLLEHFLSELPTSLRDAYGFTSMAAASTLLQINSNVTFEFEKLTIWNDNVLVARLTTRGTDQNSANALSRIKTHRTALYSQFQEEFYLSSDTEKDPKEQSFPYSPHVSLGYFGNTKRGGAAQSRLAQWTPVFMRHTRNKSRRKTITFDSISLYGFTDMATFFKSR